MHAKKDLLMQPLRRTHSCFMVVTAYTLLVSRISVQPFFLSSTRCTSRFLLRRDPALGLAFSSTAPADLAAADAFARTMPSLPYPYLRSQSQLPSETSLLDLSEMGEALVKADEKKQAAYAQSRKLQMALIKARVRLESGATDVTDKTGMEDATATTSTVFDVESSLIPALTAVIPESSTRDGREANLSVRVEDYARFHAYCHFLTTGGLLAPASCRYATDEEYLAGACMGLCQELARYGMGRATVRDAESVTQAKELVQKILEYLMKFDFRNGPLRRKYDGTKYALRSLETLLYELSITGTAVNECKNEKETDGPNKKRSRTSKVGTEEGNDESEGDSPLWPENELDAIRARIEHRDELRETLIKRCRDAQKNAKQAIYALHRGDVARANKLILECETCIQKDLSPTVLEEPSLRYGSFANVLEEYAEAKMFFTWLLGKHVSSDKLKGKNDSLASSIGHLMQPDEFTADVIELTPEEYLGGLCDLTGEIGRYAVQRGTVRDEIGVKKCLESNAAVHNAIQLMERYPGGINKKMDQLRHSVEKLERMLYEMSLSEAAGGRKVETEEIQMDFENEE